MGFIRTITFTRLSFYDEWNVNSSRLMIEKLKKINNFPLFMKELGAAGEIHQEEVVYMWTSS